MENPNSAPAEARVAPVENREAPAIVEFAQNVWSSGERTDDRLSANRFAGRSTENSDFLDFSVGDPLAAFRGDNRFSPANGSGTMDGNIQTASLRPPDTKEHVKHNLEETRRAYAGITAVSGGDTSQIGQFIKEMNQSPSEHRREELRLSLKHIGDFLNRYGIRTSLQDGNYSITLPGKDGKTLTIDKDGRPNLSGRELRDFGKKFDNQFVEKETPEQPLSRRMERRLDDIHGDLERNSVRGLTSAIKEIGDKIHSTKPGALGETERKTGKELQQMLAKLGDEISSEAVDARYDKQSGNFTIAQPNARGQMETLTIDKFGRTSMTGVDLNIFMWRLNLNRTKVPTVQV